MHDLWTRATIPNSQTETELHVLAARYQYHRITVLPYHRIRLRGLSDSLLRHRHPRTNVATRSHRTDWTVSTSTVSFPSSAIGEEVEGHTELLRHQAQNPDNNFKRKRYAFAIVSLRPERTVDVSLVDAHNLRSRSTSPSLPSRQFCQSSKTSLDPTSDLTTEQRPPSPLKHLWATRDR